MLSGESEDFHYIDKNNNYKVIKFSKPPTDAKHAIVQVVPSHHSSTITTSGTTINTPKSPSTPKISSEYTLNATNTNFSIKYTGYSTKTFEGVNMNTISFDITNSTGNYLNLNILYSSNYASSNFYDGYNLQEENSFLINTNGTESFRPNTIAPNSISTLTMATTPVKDSEKEETYSITFSDPNKVETHIVYPNLEKFLNS